MDDTQILAPQRKDLDAVYAASNGILVPRIFGTLEEAKQFVLREGGTLIIRSEHPLEKKGLSGLNMSPVVSPEIAAYDEKEGGMFASFRAFTPEMLEYLMKEWHKKHDHWWNASNYCDENKIDPEEYVRELAHSFWEYIPGYNLYVVADPAVANRYRVFTSWSEPKLNRKGLRYRSSYDVFDGGIRLSDGGTPEAVLSKREEIFYQYNKIRATFGEDMCWVVEMQLSARGELYFLQRSMGQKFNPCRWSFEAPEQCDFLIGPSYGYGEVRGTTPKEGISITFLLERATRARWLKDFNLSALLCSHLDSTVAEQRRLTSVMAYIKTYPQYHGDGVRDPHSVILPMVRAPLYLYMPGLHKRFSTDIQEKIKLLEKEKRVVDEWYTDMSNMVHVTFHVRSDGNEARINVQNIA